MPETVMCKECTLILQGIASNTPDIHNGKRWVQSGFMQTVNLGNQKADIAPKTQDLYSVHRVTLDSTLIHMVR